MLTGIPKERESLINLTAAKSETRLSHRAIERGLRRRPVLSYWLITKNENGRMEVFTALLAGGGEALPIFSYEQEATLFLGFQAAGSGWRVRECTAGELISVLCGPCVGTKEVFLDPLPEMLAEGTLGLVNLSRKRFVDLVLSRELTAEAGRERRSRPHARTKGAPPREGFGEPSGSPAGLQQSGVERGCLE